MLFFYFDLRVFAYNGVIVEEDIAFISISSFNITNFHSPCNNVYLWWICVSIFMWILKIWGKIKPWKNLENGGTAYSLGFRLVDGAVGINVSAKEIFAMHMHSQVSLTWPVFFSLMWKKLMLINDVIQHHPQLINIYCFNLITLEEIKSLIKTMHLESWKTCFYK